MSRTIKHIVVATDLSKTSERAVELGREMAADKGAKLSVVCSIDPEPYFISDLDPTMLDLTPSLGEELRKVAERGLQRLRDQQLGGSADVTLAVLEGRSPGAAVVEPGVRGLGASHKSLFAKGL